MILDNKIVESLIFGSLWKQKECFLKKQAP